MNILQRFFGSKPAQVEVAPKAPEVTPKNPIVVNAGVNRSTQPTYETQVSYDSLVILGQTNNQLLPQFNPDIIPLLRKLAMVNFDLSQALDNFVQLGNTGHKIKFDSAVSTDQQTRMNQHLNKKFKIWGDSEAGIDGLVNKMISQLCVSGALSNEWIPSNNLSEGIVNIALVNPETIIFVYDPKLGKHEPYQKVSGNTFDPVTLNGLKKLNPNTYKYFGLNGDTDLPYGVPPFLAALDNIALQRIMLSSIKFLAEQVGAGFLQVLYEKPDKLASESETTYIKRLEKMLDEAVVKVQKGVRDGVVVGYKNDTEFEFHSISRDLAAYKDVFEMNETLIASGIKTDGTMLGRNNGTSETHITVVFSKLISQLKNIQNIVKANLEFGYSLELRLAGFKFKELSVEFNQSVTVDQLKAEQTAEIKIRNLNALFYDGIINLDEYARQMGYSEADQKEIRFLRNNVQTEEEARQKTEKKKDSSDKKVRDKNRPRPRKLSNCPTCEYDISFMEIEDHSKCPRCNANILENEEA